MTDESLILHRLETMALSTLIGTQFGSLLYPSLEPESVATVILTAALFAANVAAIGVLVFFVVRGVWKARARNGGSALGTRAGELWRASTRTLSSFKTAGIGRRRWGGGGGEGEGGVGRNGGSGTGVDWRWRWSTATRSRSFGEECRDGCGGCGSGGAASAAAAGRPVLAANTDSDASSGAPLWRAAHEQDHDSDVSSFCGPTRLRRSVSTSSNFDEARA